MFYVIRSGTGGSLDLGSLAWTNGISAEDYEDYVSYEEGSLDKIIDDSDNENSNQELTSKSKSYRHMKIDIESRVGRCSIQNNR